MRSEGTSHRPNILTSTAAEQATELIYDLQKIAYDAGHPVPLAVGLDQENGGVNSLFDEIYIRQYPSAMGIAATGSSDVAYEVAKATAEELASCGINWIMGPCLDTLSNARSQILGVRAFGDDPQLVSNFGTQSLKGYQDAGLVTMGKHFPSYGNLDTGSALDVPTITDSLEQLSLSALVPFRNAVKAGLDGMMVGGCAMSSEGLEVMHACLSEQVVDNLLRDDMHFDGVVVSECLEMDALTYNIGVGGGTVMAINAGCDIVLLCRSYTHQQEALQGLKLGMENAVIAESRMRNSFRRVLEMKSKCTSWEGALNPKGVEYLTTLQPQHTALSRKAYNASISVLRDRGNLLPITNLVEPDEEILLLTPLLKPLAASAASRAMSNLALESPGPHVWTRNSAVMSGEQVFGEFGRSLARARSGRVLHTSYTQSGLRPVHENLIQRASAVIVITADANRNLYQSGFTKHLALMCKTQGSRDREKPLIVAAVSSPYDFAVDSSLGTYICTYDFTETSLNSLVGVLCGDILASGSLPSSVPHSHKLQQSRSHWLVEVFNEDRDANALDELIQTVIKDNPTEASSELSGASSNSVLLHHAEIVEAHFVVRNSSTQALYGFCSTYYFKATKTGVIGVLIVDPSRRKLSVGKSLHNRAIRTLLQREGISRFQLGSRLPSIYLGIPAGRNLEAKRLRAYFANLGWNTALSRPVCSMIVRNLLDWQAPNGMAKSLQTATAEFDLVYGTDYSISVLDHIKTNSRQGLAEVYKLAMADPSACGIIRAKRPSDGTLLGTTVLYNQQSRLAEMVPAMKATAELTGGISSPVISPGAGEYSTILQSLLLLGLRQVKQQNCNSCVLDYVDGDGNINSLSVMGFELLHSFEEISCDAATFTMMSPPEQPSNTSRGSHEH